MKKLISILLAVLFICSYSISKSGQKDIIKEADLLLDMMEYKASISTYLKALSKDPKRQDLRKNIAYAYFELERIEDAVKFLREELDLFPDNRDAYDLLVYILHLNKRTEEAFDLFPHILFRLRRCRNLFDPVVNFLSEIYDFQDHKTISDTENPNSGLGDFILGMHNKERGKFVFANIYFRRALKRNFHPILCYLQLADIRIIQDDLKGFLQIMDEANKDYYEIYGGRDKSYEFFFMYGLLYYKLFSFDRDKIHDFNKKDYASEYFQFARGMFEESLRIKPDSKDSLFNLGCIHYNFDQFEEAVKYFKRILRKEPENTDIKFYLDCCRKKLAQSTHKESISGKCPKIINLNKDFLDKPDIKYQYQFKNDILYVLQNISYLAFEFIKKGKFHEGLRRYYNGLKIYPESPEINFNLGMVYFWQNNFEEAEKHALTALRREYFYVTIPDILVPGKLNWYEREELLKKAHDSIHKSPDIPFSEWNFNAALKEGNYFLEAYDLLGNIYFKKGEFAKSVLAYKKAIELKHIDAMGHYNLGCAYWALDNWENAEKEWKRAIKYEEEATEREKEGKISKDQLAISLIVHKRPVSFRAHKSLGNLYLKQNFADKALKEFKKAIKLEPGDPEPYYALGKIYQAKSELNEKYVEKAIFYYEKYVYLGGEEEGKVKELLKLLK